MLLIALTVLISYGMTLILVQGKIFNTFKIKLSNSVEYFYDFLYPNDIIIGNMILTNSSEIDAKHISLYYDLLTRIQTNNDPKLLELLQELQIKIKNNVLISRKNKRLKLFSYKILYKFLGVLQSLLQCMMCTGFWVGIFLSTITLFFNISIFGNSLSIISVQDITSTIIAVFLVGCLLSGTTWIINAFVDFFVDMKDKLSSFIDKNIHNN